MARCRRNIRPPFRFVKALGGKGEILSRNFLFRNLYDHTDEFTRTSAIQDTTSFASKDKSRKSPKKGKLQTINIDAETLKKVVEEKMHKLKSGDLINDYGLTVADYETVLDPDHSDHGKKLDKFFSAIVRDIFQSMSERGFDRRSAIAAITPTKILNSIRKEVLNHHVNDIKRIMVKYEKAQFYRTKKEITAKIPPDVKGDFRELCFVLWEKKYWMPAIQLGPYDVPPGELRQKWMKMFERCSTNGRKMSRLVYLYGSSHEDRSQSFLFCTQAKLTDYKLGCSKGYNQGTILYKTNRDKTFQQKMNGLKEAENDEKLPRKLRLAWLNFTEDYQVMHYSNGDVSDDSTEMSTSSVHESNASLSSTAHHDSASYASITANHENGGFSTPGVNNEFAEIYSLDRHSDQRDLWACNICEQAFPAYEEAVEHEAACANRAPIRDAPARELCITVIDDSDDGVGIESIPENFVKHHSATAVSPDFNSSNRTPLHGSVQSASVCSEPGTQLVSFREDGRIVCHSDIGSEIDQTSEVDIALYSSAKEQLSDDVWSNASNTVKASAETNFQRSNQQTVQHSSAQQMETLRSRSPVETHCARYTVICDVNDAISSRPGQHMSVLEDPCQDSEDFFALVRKRRRNPENDTGINDVAASAIVPVERTQRLEASLPPRYSTEEDELIFPTCRLCSSYASCGSINIAVLCKHWVDPNSKLHIYLTKMMKMTYAKVCEVISSYCEFLTLKLLLKDYDDNFIFPPSDVYEVWNAHRNDTKAYLTFNRTVMKDSTLFIHHDPMGVLDDPSKTLARARATIAEYETYFKKPCPWTFECGAASLPYRGLDKV